MTDCTTQRRPNKGHRLENPSQDLKEQADQPNRFTKDLEQEPRIVLCGAGRQRALLLEDRSERECHRCQDGNGFTQSAMPLLSAQRGLRPVVTRRNLGS